MEESALDGATEWGQDPTSDSFDKSRYVHWESRSTPGHVPLANSCCDQLTTNAFYGQDGLPPAGDASSFQASPTEYWPIPNAELSTFPALSFWPESPNTLVYGTKPVYGTIPASEAIPIDKGTPVDRTTPVDKTTPVVRTTSSLTIKEPRKRRQKQPQEPPTLQSTRRNPARSTQVKPRSRRRSEASRPQSRNFGHGEGDVDGELDLEEEEEEGSSKRVQQRNRIASNKFRVKKRNDAIKLKSDEEDMERINRELNNHVANLTQDVYALKMQLLQHTNCNCSMIQQYISSEAQRYVRKLS